MASSSNTTSSLLLLPTLLLLLLVFLLFLIYNDNHAAPTSYISSSIGTHDTLADPLASEQENRTTTDRIETQSLAASVYGSSVDMDRLSASTSSEKENQITDPMEIQSLTASVSVSSVDIDRFSASTYKSKQPNSPSYIKKKSSLEKIEDDLAKARAAIRRAVRVSNYSSDKEETFIPRGSIYWNPISFHQSHIEMVKRFKVWTYREGETPLVHGSPVNNIYAMEGQFMEEMEDNINPFRASHPDRAHAFYMPFSVARIVEYVYKPILSKVDYSRDRLHRVVNDYIGLISKRHSYWNRSSGADHFMVSCHDWGPDVSLENGEELFKNVIRVLCNANTTEGFDPQRDVSMAEIDVRAGELGPLTFSLPSNNRTILSFFAGGAHGYIRKAVLQHWKGKDDEVQVYEYLPKTMTKNNGYFRLMGKSKFCLCPSGYEVASARPVEAILSGCVPVIISDNYSLPFSDILNWSAFSVQIPVERIPEIKTILQAIPYPKYEEMQRNVESVRKHFELHRPARPFDIFHMVLHSVWLRRLNIKLHE